jgi:preprotein translocase subunit SecE
MAKKKEVVTKGDFIENNSQQKEVKETQKKEKTNKNKKPGFFKRLGNKIKDVFSELKRVSWPTFTKVLKQTGIVLAVVLVFLVVITAFDFGLMQLLRLVSPNVG